MTPQREEAIRFADIAERDRQAFRILAASPESSMAVLGFHAQQAVEKAMKAVLIDHAIEFRRTHDLQELAEMLREVGLQTPVADERLRRLSVFAVEARYQIVDIVGLGRDELSVTMNTLVDWARDVIQKRAAEE